jgi:hypothetical protein
MGARGSIGFSSYMPGWKDVYYILVKDGHNVSIVQEPETSFQDVQVYFKLVAVLVRFVCLMGMFFILLTVSAEPISKSSHSCYILESDWNKCYRIGIPKPLVPRY